MEPKDIQKVRDKALHLLARRDHSAFELRNKLKQKLRVESEVLDTVISQLKELGYLVQEKDLSMRWATQWRKEGRGRHWISGKLRTKGLECPDLRDDEDEMEAARLFLEKKMGAKSLKDLNRDERARLGRSLISRGFSSSLVATLFK